jgi:3-phenylpropionate/trans-cinnamate dioxygenase ferredoxin reductase component
MTPQQADGPLDPDGSVVIVGAGLGGLRCAEALRDLGFAGRVMLVGAEDHLPYDRPPLTKQFLAGTWDEPRIGLVTAERLAERGIKHVAGVRATALDVEARRVTLDDGSSLDADAVVLATGASPRWLPGTEGADGVHVVRTIDDSAALRDELDACSERDEVVVIGGGFIGAEVASTAAARGLRTTILEALDVPLAPVVGDEVGGWLVELHRRAGVEVRAGVQVAGVAGRTADSAASVSLATGEKLVASAIVVGIGVRPETAWLDGSGLELDDGVVVDAALFAAPGVCAIGDLARFTWQHAGTSEQVRIEHWEVTNQLASHAAGSLLAGIRSAAPVSLVPYFWSDQHGRKLQVLGRPSGTDEVSWVTGSIDEGKFTFLYHRDGRLTGVLGLASPRNVMRCHDLVDRGAQLNEAVALFG